MAAPEAIPMQEDTDPQAYEANQENFTKISATGGPKLKEIILRSTLLFESDDPIGKLSQPADCDRYLRTRIFAITPVGWTADFCFKIDLVERNRTVNTSSVVHQYAFSLHKECQSEPITYYPFIPAEVDEQDSHWQNLFSRAFVRIENGEAKVDPVAAALRKQSELLGVRFAFTPTDAHTEGILIDTLSRVEGFESIHKRLKEIFSRTEKIRLYAFISAVSKFSFEGQYAAFTSAIVAEDTTYPLGKFYPGSTSLVPPAKLQKGQLLKYSELPNLPDIPTKWSYRDANHCWTIEGYNIILEEERDEREIEASITRNCELRLLVSAPGGEREMIGLLRLPDGFERRLISRERLTVIIYEVEWEAHVQEEQVVYSAATDITILLHRPRDENSPSGWLEQNLPYLDLRNLQRDNSHRQILDHCYHSPPIMVKVRAQVDRKIARVKL